ncbi:ATP-grasp domain-containing protein [Kitasatospora kazusensis]|uniref:ATP-grasp domain-containing protein n=1 Tax=Kitasatospora kazusensis TaxID=407974 RepID=A0ABN3AA36_9ACTN
MPAPVILLPADPLAPRRPDPHYVWEAQQVRELGGEYALLDHDALLAGEAGEAVRRVPAGSGPFWYRGWMIPVPAYAALAQALGGRGCTLLTTPSSYANAHELPGWYGVFEGATPSSSWIPGNGVPDAGALAESARLLGGQGPAIVKDYVKSRKHEWDEACYVPELGDLPALARVVSRFVELQGEFMTGGVVLRRFEEFVRDEQGRAVEARVWWVDGEPVLVGPHPDNPGSTPEPGLSQVRTLVRALGCRFVTTDLAQLADGRGWRVVEVGDGQVSDLPRGIDASALLAPLIAA